MLMDIRLSPNSNGSYDVIILFDDFSSETASGGNIFQQDNNLVKYFLESFTKKRVIRYVKILSGGVLIAMIALSPLAEVKSSANAMYSMSYVYFGSEAARIANVANAQGALNNVSPSYFNLSAAGNLSIEGLSSTFISEMHSRSITVVPFVSNHWDRAKGEKALDNAEALSTQIAQAVIKYNLDGVNVDIENLTETYRAKYVTFVRLLREKLPSNKEVSVAVAANPRGLSTGWQGSYDYEALSEYADYLMIMAYDEHYQGGAAGPVASSFFVESSIKYALKYVPPEKIVLGLPFYGRIWGGNAGGTGLSLTRTEALVSAYGGKVTYDETTQSVKATFTIRSSDTKPTVTGKTLTAGNYTIWYENSQSIRYKLYLISKYNLKGAGSWSLGQETRAVMQGYSSWIEGMIFRDINEYWARDSIIALASKGIIQGVAPDQFAPTAPLTRAEAAALICRIRGLDVPASVQDGFTDVDGHWARDYINAAETAGLVVGVGDGKFEPDREMTREEISVMLFRLIGLQEPSVGSTTTFADVGSDRWSYPEIESLAGAGIVSGYAGGVFAPQKLVSRGEMAALLDRIQGYISNGV